MKIGILSDTHGWFDPLLEAFFIDCDEVWHAGDIGDEDTALLLEKKYKLRAVFGNIDGGNLRLMYPKIQRFTIEGVKVIMTHIGGYPGRYDAEIKPVLQSEHPQLFVCGHSHITKVMYDKKYGCLHINPGAAGANGFHKVRTAVRLDIEGGIMKNLEIVEYPRNNKIKGEV